MTHVMDIFNHQAFENQVAFETYRKARGLKPAEEAILARLRPRIVDKKLLDIGVGGGRTTPFLLELSRDYKAINYSARLVQQVKAKFGVLL